MGFVFRTPVELIALVGAVTTQADTWGRYALKVLELLPYPVSVEPIPMENYKVTIIVREDQDVVAASGVRGRVTIGPNCPVMRADQPCPDKPYGATMILLDSTGSQVARAVSGADGQYSIAAPPGSYTLVPKRPRGRPFPHASPVDVVVIEDGWTVIDVSYDTGIR